MPILSYFKFNELLNTEPFSLKLSPVLNFNGTRDEFIDTTIVIIFSTVILNGIAAGEEILDVIWIAFFSSTLI